MKKIYLTLFFTITLSSELILEITQGQKILLESLY